MKWIRLIYLFIKNSCN
uniref:Uncharacterized protein n=1 Tax=Anguilla anguilla TaxID=7936 RepID=A0A0E9SJL7_ANGAN